MIREKCCVTCSFYNLCSGKCTLTGCRKSEHDYCRYYDRYTIDELPEDLGWE